VELVLQILNVVGVQQPENVNQEITWDLLRLFVLDQIGLEIQIFIVQQSMIVLL